MKVLSSEEVRKHLDLHLKKWKFADTCIKREFKFSNFIEAFSFMTAIALEAEKMDHHPDWSNVYNKVSISLCTHEPTGITQNDVDLAAKIDNLYSKTEN